MRQNDGGTQACARGNFVPDAGGNCEKKIDCFYRVPDGADLRKYVLRLTKFSQNVNKI